MNGHFCYLRLGFCSLREQVKVHSSPHHCLSERIIKLCSCFGDTLSELDAESCVLNCILVNITGSSFSATGKWDGVKHHRLACSSMGETKKEKERGEGRNGNLPNSNHIITEISLMTLTTTAVISMRKVQMKASSLVNLRAVASPGCPMSSFPLISSVVSFFNYYYEIN